jgi:pimeloyl-ACP methyl ester carboxylesterase
MPLLGGPLGDQAMEFSTTTPAAAVQKNDGMPSAQAWFAGGGRIGYDPKARAVARQAARLNIFLRREGDPAHAVTFLPGYPDGSFGWARVLPFLPNAAEMPKLFVEYVGMGDSDKPKDYAYSTAERADLVEAVWRELSVRSTTVIAFDFSAAWTSAVFSRPIAASFPSSLAAAWKIRSSAARSTLHRKGWARSASGSSVCPAGASPRTSSRKPGGINHGLRARVVEKGLSRGAHVKSDAAACAGRR